MLQAQSLQGVYILYPPPPPPRLYRFSKWIISWMRGGGCLPASRGACIQIFRSSSHQRKHQLYPAQFIGHLMNAFPFFLALSRVVLGKRGLGEG